MTERQFWTKVRKRRDHFFWWWLAWIPFATIFIVACAAMFEEVASYAVFVALILWFAAWVWISNRLGRLPCPRCGKPAIKSPYFLIRNATCQWCGLRQGNHEAPHNFFARPVRELQWILADTWCDTCQEADLGMIDPHEYEVNGSKIVEGTCRKCGSRIKNLITEK
jgi:hypothetical protein